MNLLVKSFPRFVESDMTVMTDSEKLKIYAAKERRSIAEILRELIDKNIPAQN